MDSKSHIINLLKEFVTSIEEEVLIGMSNKGTVNRGKKDLEKIKDAIKVEEMEGKIRVSLTEGVSVRIGGLHDLSCSCPALGICRHEITALFYIKEYYETDKKAQQRQEHYFTTDDFKELNEITAEKLKEIIGAKEYRACLLGAQARDEVKFMYGELLKVERKMEDNVVYFPRKDSIAHAVCSCKAQGICRHKAYALIFYLMKERGIELSVEEENRELGEKQREYLSTVKRQMTSYLEKGMASLTESVIQESERNYIRAEGMGLYGLAEDFKVLSGEFGYYFSKNVQFSNKRAMHQISRIYNRAYSLLVIEDENKRNQLIGTRKEESYSINGVNLIGLGFSFRLTRRKDLYLSIYLYCEELEEMLILSTMRPDKGKSSEGAFLRKEEIFWKEELSAIQLSAQRILVKNALITSGKISGTKATSGTLLGSTKEEDIEKIAYTDFKLLREKLQANSAFYFKRFSEAASIYLVRVFSYKTSWYDSVQQKFFARIGDEAGEEICMEIPYSVFSKKVIERLETDGGDFSYILGSFFLRRGELCGTWLSGIKSGKIVDFYS